MLDAGHPVWAWWQHKCGPGQGIFCQAGSTKPKLQVVFPSFVPVLTCKLYKSSIKCVYYTSIVYNMSIIHTHLNPILQLSLQASIDFMACSLPVRIRDGNGSTKDMLGESLANVGFGVPSFRLFGCQIEFAECVSEQRERNRLLWVCSQCWVGAWVGLLVSYWTCHLFRLAWQWNYKLWANLYLTESSAFWSLKRVQRNPIHLWLFPDFATQELWKCLRRPFAPNRQPR